MTKQQYSSYTLASAVKGVKVLFAHDTEIALNAAAALVNTRGLEEDRLGDLGALDEFVREWGWTGSRRRNRAELDEVRALRPRLRKLWELDEDGVAALVNELLHEARALPQLVRHDDWDYHLHATPPHAPLADRMAVEAAMAFVDVVRQGELDRLRVCDADDCADVLVDLSKNRSRRYCSNACGNRMNVAAFRARSRRSTSRR
jgi:predicted RNA-binding Zn ribbon-like protein